MSALDFHACCVAARSWCERADRALAELSCRMPGAAVADAVAGRITVLDTYVGVAAVQERALDACCVNACARMLPALWCLSATADAAPSLSPGNIGMLKLRLRPPGPRSRPPL